MPYKDTAIAKAKARERKIAWRRREKIKRFGAKNADVCMSGRHGNHARGPANGRWNGGQWIHADGYIAIAVPKTHHLRMKNGYAYIHQIEAEKILGRQLHNDETVHHIDGNVKNNKLENLLVMKRSEHARVHAVAAKRNLLGQFVPGLKRMA